MFQKQQREAFEAFRFEFLPLDEFNTSLERFKSKVNPEFPPPEYIYKKKFSFLSYPLNILQQKANLTQKKQEKKQLELPVQPEKAAISKQPLEKTRIGVILEQKVDESLYIPNRISELIKNAKNIDNQSYSSDEILQEIEELSFTDKQLEIEINHQWLKDLLAFIDNSDINKASTLNIATTQQSNILFKPLLFQIEQLNEVDTPLKKKYYSDYNKSPGYNNDSVLKSIYDREDCFSLNLDKKICNESEDEDLKTLFKDSQNRRIKSKDKEESSTNTSTATAGKFLFNS